MQHLEGSGTPVLYIGRTVLKRRNNTLELLKTLRSKKKGRCTIIIICHITVPAAFLSKFPVHPDVTLNRTNTYCRSASL